MVDPVLVVDFSYVLTLTLATMDNHAKKMAAQLILLIILVCRSMSSNDFLCISTLKIH